MLCTQIVAGEHRPSTHASVRRARARILSRLCKCDYMCYDRIYEEDRCVTQALDYSYAIYQPAFMVKACVLTANSLCACMYAYLNARVCISVCVYVYT